MEKILKWIHLVDILIKKIFIKQRTLACQSKAFAYILQREMYTMRNSVFIRQEAEMIYLQPHLGDTRCQELRSSPFCPSPLFHSQLVKEEEEFLLSKAPLKTVGVLGPIKTSPFVVPTKTKKRGSYRKHPNGG